MNKKVIEILEDKVGNKQAYFICPGCRSGHAPYIEGKGVPVWGFNNNLEKPTFTPSILVRYDYLSEEGQKKSFEFKKKNGRLPTREELPYDIHKICHSFVTDGKIKFLGDCTHDLKNTTVELNPI
ncbi:MAG: hypothetical protein JJE55_06935 [Flavobacteriaceae bacterium]|nr:hypothetical protein [Flavobacteriaceae bacterium]